MVVISNIFNIYFYYGIFSCHYILYLKKKLWSCFSIPIVYLFLLLDDSLSIHDRASINYFIVSITVILFSFLPGFISQRQEAKNFIKRNLACLIILGFFAIGIDFIDQYLRSVLTYESSIRAFFSRVVYSIEEIGEISIIAITCIWLFAKCIKIPMKISQSKQVKNMK